MRNLINFHPTAQNSKNFTSIGYFFPKDMKFELKKNTEELSLMTLNSDAKFEETLTCGFKNDMKNWVNFNQSTQKSEKLYNDGFFLPKAYNFRGKNLGDICFITLNRHAKFKGKLSCDLI